MFKIMCDGCGDEVTTTINRVGDPIIPEGWSMKITRGEVFHACSDKCQADIDASRK